MAEWNIENPHSKTEINGGQKYTINDMLSIEALNKTVENALIAVDRANAYLQEVKDRTVEITPYPIGMIIITVNDTNPNTYFGGTWELLSEGNFLISAGKGDNIKYPVGTTGGEENHTLSLSEIPAHRHEIYDSRAGSITTPATYAFVQASAVGYTPNDIADQNAIPSSNGNDGAGNYCQGKAHNNIPPYIACYMWKRVA